MMIIKSVETIQIQMFNFVTFIVGGDVTKKKKEKDSIEKLMFENGEKFFIVN